MTRDGRIELLEEKPVTLPLYTPQSPHEWRGMESGASGVKSRRVTTCFSMSEGKLGGALRGGGVLFAVNCKMVNGVGRAVGRVCHQDSSPPCITRKGDKATSGD
jgi:hypothetical protein